MRKGYSYCERLVERSNVNKCNTKLQSKRTEYYILSVFVVWFSSELKQCCNTKSFSYSCNF